MQRRRLTLVLLACGAIFFLAAVVLAVLIVSGSVTSLPWVGRVGPVAKIPEFDMPTPESLDELAAEYPEIADLLSDPELGTVYKEFLVAYQEGGMAAAEQLAQERGLLTPDGEHLRVTLVLDTEDSAALVAQLEGVGVEVVSAYQDRVNIAVAVELIRSAMESEDTEVVLGQLTELEHVIAVRMPDRREGQRVPPSSHLPYTGEGVEVVGANVWHDAGFTGEGVRVGVLDLGFDGYQALLGDELPDNVTVETFGWIDAEEVHGAACAEIVHELAPDAELFFAWYDGSDAAMGEAVEWLVAQGVDIVTHSAGSVMSPRDGSGWDARLVDDVVEDGVLWVNSAGNEADVHYRDVYTDDDGDGYHEFISGDEVLPIYLEGYVQVYLMWQESWSAPGQDYELYIIDAGGNILASSEDPQDGGAGQQPAEFVILQTNESVVYAAMLAYDADRPVVFDIFLHGPGAWLPDATPEYSVNSPGDAVGALTVGAVDWDTDELAFYSSQGPTTDERLKPEISGPTKVSGTTYGRYGFTGTSASTPHIAGVAALVWQAYPAFTRQDVSDFLLAAVEDLGPAGPDTGYGFGRLLLPAPPEAAVIGPTPTPVAADVEDESVQAPVPLPTPTAFAYVTPAPVTESSGGGLSNPLLLVALLVGGMGLGGGGLLLIGGVLLVVDLRGRRRARQVQPPASMPARSASPAPFDRRPQPSFQTPPSAAGQQARGADARPSAASHEELPPTRMWMGPGAGMQAEPQSHDAAPVHEAICASCGASLRPGVRFCAKCGASVVEAKVCKSCGASIRPGSRFCPKCGTPIHE